MTERSTLLILLTAIYIASEAVSNVTAGRLVQLGPLIFPGAIFLYALTFTLRDAVHTAGGWKAAKALLWGGLATNAIVAGYSALVIALPSPGFFHGEAYATVLGSTLRVVAASLAAYGVSTALEALVFERLRARSVVIQVAFSNLVGTALDTVIFVGLAFGGTGAPLLNLMLAQWIIKMIISLILIPLVRWVRTKVETTTPAARAELA